MNLLRLGGRFALATGMAAVVVLVGGAATGRADPESCNLAPKARPICITIVQNGGAVVGPSRSTVDTHYMHFSVTVRNGGSSSTFTHPTVRLSWTDIQAGGEVPSTAAFDASQSTMACIPSTTAVNTLDCSAPNLGPNESVTYSLVFRTSTLEATIATRLLAYVAVNEVTNEQLPDRDPVDEDWTESADMTYENELDAQRSWVFPGGTVTLKTTMTGQFSIFKVPVPPSFGNSFFAQLIESPASAGFCPTCFADQLTTIAPGVFDATNIIEVQTTIPMSLVSGTVDEIVFHKLDSGFVEEITNKCTGAIDSGTPPFSELSCARWEKKGGKLTVEAFSKLGNGEWGFS